MDFAQVLMVLWRRRWWVALGALLALVIGLSTGYRIGVFPPRLTAKSLPIGSASTKLLVDSPRSALTDLTKDVTTLEVRATVLAPFMTTEPVRRAIAAAVGLRESAIYTTAPLSPDASAATFGPSAAQRSQQLLGQNLGYRLSFAADLNQPTITVTAQTSRAADAIRLANGAATGVINYLSHIEQIQGIPFGHRTIIRQLGPAAGGTIGGSVNTQLVAVTFVGALIGWMVLVVIFSSVIENLREIRVSGRGTPDGTAEPS